MIEELRKNIESQKGMLRELSNYNSKIDLIQGPEKKIYIQAVESLKRRMKLVNNAIPGILKTVSVAKKLPKETKKILRKSNIEEVKYNGREKNIDVALQKKDKARFLKELRITENLFSKIKKKEKIDEKEKFREFKSSRGYLKLSNKYFLKTAIDLVKKGYFKNLALDLKKGNFEVLLETYVAMMLFSTLISIFFGIGLVIFLLFFNISLFFPFITFYEGDILFRFLKIFWIVLAAPVLTFLSIYVYPSTEKKSLAWKIDQELPFAVIHMSSISGSGIAPSEIFKIIGLSREYPSLGREIRKVLNQINLYGYDLVTALTNASKSASSQKLAELFSGLATTISTGGDLTEFFDKRAQSLLLQYRLEREKFSKIAETFMDIYISVVIAAPMILMLLIMMISITGTQVGLSLTQISFLIIAVIALINIIFLFILNLKQPSY